MCVFHMVIRTPINILLYVKVIKKMLQKLRGWFLD
jgi:hypothetical protein